MRRLLLLGLLFAAAAAGCRSMDKKEAVGAAEPSRWRVPDILAADYWWAKGEMGDVEP